MARKDDLFAQRRPSRRRRTTEERPNHRREARISLSYLTPRYVSSYKFEHGARCVPDLQLNCQYTLPHQFPHGAVEAVEGERIHAPAEQLADHAHRIGHVPLV